MKELTEKQERILRFIRSKQDSAELVPTLREIAAHFRFRSPNAALAHVQALLAKGVLKNLPARARSLRPHDPTASKVPLRPQVVPVPIYGAIPAGLPKEATQEIGRASCRE